jgi:hypothetical protein
MVFIKVLPEHLVDLRTGMRYEATVAKNGFKEVQRINGTTARYDLYQEGKPYKSEFLQQLRAPKPTVIITNALPGK